MNYNKGFNYSDLLTDKKYRSRLILAIYAVLFLVLIVFLRTSFKNDSMTNNIDDNSTINEVEDNNTENNNQDNNLSGDNNEKDEKIEQLFSHIDMNNYNFEYILYYNEEVYSAKGKRFNNKYEFTFTDGTNTMEYLVKGVIVKVKNEEGEDELYQNAPLPYYYINYFDTEVLKSIISNAKEVENDKYEIKNENLLKYVENSNGFNKEHLQDVNLINLNLKNNKIVGINMDISNLFLGNDDVSNVKIELKYEDFGLIDDFEVIFE